MSRYLELIVTLDGVDPAPRRRFLLAADATFAELHLASQSACRWQDSHGCPVRRAEEIAVRTAVRGSGRVGRRAAGRRLAPEAVELAVVASVRHRDTGYDELLMAGVPRAEARDRVGADVAAVLDRWRG